MSFRLWFIIFALYPSYAFADYKLNERTQYHSVTEENPYNVLNAAVNTLAQHCNAGHAVGCAASNFSYQYKFEQLSEKRCRVSNFSVTHNITYHIPRWAHAKKSEYRKQWKSIEKEILQHEKKHGSIYRNTLRSAYNSLRKFTTNCSDIKSTINTRLERAKEKAEKQHARFHERRGDSLSRSFPYK